MSVIMHPSVIARMALASSMLLLVNETTHAAAYELTVYSDEISAPEETEVEVMYSLAKPRSKSVSTGRVSQLLGEMNYGIAKGWEVGIEIPALIASSTRKVEGFALEVQYVAPHDKAGGWYWGGRSDIGRIVSLYEDDPALSLELNPILGYRSTNYRFVFNPSIEKALNGKETTVRFHPSAKFSQRMTATDELGFEYFADWGAVHQLSPPNKRDETLYFVWDKRTFFGRLNVGLGQPLRPTSGSADKWVAKVSLQFETD